MGFESFLNEGKVFAEVTARGLGERCKLPQRGARAEPRPKTNLVHSKAVRKPLVAIILNILTSMFYRKTITI